MTLLINHELVCRTKLCLVSVFPDIVKDCRKTRNLPKTFLRSLENVGPNFNQRYEQYSILSTRLKGESKRKEIPFCHTPLAAPNADISLRVDDSEPHQLLHSGRGCWISGPVG